MNILMVVEDPKLLAGTERSVSLATRGLQAAGHRVYLLHCGESMVDDLMDGDIALPDLFDLGPLFEPTAVRVAQVRLLDFITEHGIDVMHLHTVLRFAVCRRLVRRVPLVFTVHVVLCPNGARYLWNERRVCNRKIGLRCLSVGYRTKGCGHLGNSEPIGIPAFSRAMVNDRLTRAEVGRCHRVVAPSQWMGRYLAANGTAESKIRVVEPPIASLPSSVAPNPDGVPMLTFVGRLVDFKGADQLIRCSLLLDFDHRIVIVGKGPMEGELRQLASDMGVRDRVDLLGQLRPDEVDAVRLQSSVVVVPSLLPENYAMVGPEALALGIPVVGYRVGGSSEWLRLGGSLAAGVDPGDVQGLAREIHRFVLHPPSPEARQSVARRVGERLAVSRHCDRLLSVYAQAIDEFISDSASSGHRLGTAGASASTRSGQVL